MSSAYPMIQAFSYAGGTILAISFDITCVGASVDAQVKLFIIEEVKDGAVLGEYSQDVSFVADEEQTVTFEHAAVATNVVGRTIVLEIWAEDMLTYSDDWPDAFGAAAAPGMIESIMPLMILVMMMGMVQPMMAGQNAQVS